MSQEVHISNIVVGDLLLLQAGDRVPADCILVQGMDLRVD
jgi:magnesium-transporting ATPase (P-type)